MVGCPRSIVVAVVQLMRVVGDVEQLVMHDGLEIVPVSEARELCIQQITIDTSWRAGR